MSSRARSCSRARSGGRSTCRPRGTAPSTRWCRPARPRFTTATGCGAPAPTSTRARARSPSPGRSGGRTSSPDGHVRQPLAPRRFEFLLVRSEFSGMLPAPGIATTERRDRRHQEPSMPSSIPSGAAAGLPPAAKIDPRGHRFGAGVSAVLLIVAFVANAPWLVAVALASIGVSAAFGLRYSIYGAIWRRIVRLARLGPAEPEHEYPPRFAQVLGSTALTLSLVSFVIGATGLGWVF